MSTKKYKVLILEDNQAWTDVLKWCINKSEDFEVVKATASETTAFEFTKTYLPDAVVVDLLLHSDESEGDGMEFLTRLSDPSENLPKQPYKVVVTSVASEKTLTKLSNGLADFTYRKKVIGDDPEHILKHLRSMADVFECNADFRTYDKRRQKSLLDRETLIEARITTELDSYCVNQSAVGKDFLAEAILKVIHLPENEPPQMKAILTDIGKKYKKDAHAVNMAIDRVVLSAFTRTAEDELRELYPPNYDMERGAPTNKDFIVYVAKKIKAENIN